MTEFRTPIDIANRALQYVGAEKISDTQGFAENSKGARETSFAYPKLRRAELERNVWRFARRKAVLRPVDSNTMILAPALWVASTTYFYGSVVSDEYNNLWISRVQSNLGNHPLLSTTWEPYFGPLTVQPYSSTTTYYAGELVYVTDGDGTYSTFLSITNGADSDPEMADTWAATTTYRKNDIVKVSSTRYMSRIDFNLNNDPTTTVYADWTSTTTYATGNKVAGSDGYVYTSLSNGNLNHDPVLDGGVHWSTANVLAAWTTDFTGGGNSDWLQIGGAGFPNGVGLSVVRLFWPIGTGPFSQSGTRNVFRLPSGFLRKAPRDAKAGSASYLGAETGLPYADWDIEGKYLVSRDVDPIIFPFIADVTDVVEMNDMFCEGLAARLAFEICEPLTQSTAKRAAIKQFYDDMMTQARTVNAIEVGSEEAPVDDWIACRV